MNYINNIINQKKFSKINLVKIAIILFSSFYLIGNFEPYYDFEGIDPLVYALTAIEISNGSYENGNVLLEQTGRWEFVPHQWVKTIDDTAIPRASPGLPFLASLFYLIGNDYGLFYLVPVLTISLLIISERIATKLFDEKIGLLSLLLLSTNFMIFTVGDNLVTDSIFTIFVLLGGYYFLKFLKNNENSSIVLSSVFFVAASLFRIIGVIFLPVEILFFAGYLIISTTKNNENKTSLIKFLKRLSHIVKKRKTILFFIFLIIPWFGFFLFVATYNYHYFGNPSIGYGNIIGIPTSLSEFDNSTDILKIRSKLFNISDDPNVQTVEGSAIFSKRIAAIGERLEVAQGYFLYLLPSQFPWAQTLLEPYEKDLGNNFLGYVSILILSPILVLSIITKSYRREVIAFVLIILSLAGIYSLTTLTFDIVGRYMMPAIPFFSILLGFFILKIFKIIPKIGASRPIISQILMTAFLIFLIVYFSFTFFISDQVQWLISENFEFKNPQDYLRKYPLDREGISENSILVNYYGSRAIEYGIIPFNGYLGNYAGAYSPDGFSKGSVQLLKSAMNSNYDAYVLKKPKFIHDKEYFNFLLNENLVLKDFSKTFCKIELATNSSGKIIPEPDQICYEEVKWPKEKRWYDFLLK